MPKDIHTVLRERSLKDLSGCWVWTGKTNPKG
jgi:hypothetical protein